MSDSGSFQKWIDAEPGFQPPGASWYPIEYPEPDRALPKIKRGRNKINFSVFALSPDMLTGPLSNISTEESESSNVSASTPTFLVPANQIRSAHVSKKQNSYENTTRYDTPEDAKKRFQDPNRTEDPNKISYSNIDDPNSKRNEWRSHTFVLKPRLAPKTPSNFINTSTASFSPINRRTGLPGAATGSTSLVTNNSVSEFPNNTTSDSPVVTATSSMSITNSALNKSPILAPRVTNSSSSITKDFAGNTNSTPQAVSTKQIAPAKVGRPSNHNSLGGIGKPVTIKPIAKKLDERAIHSGTKIVPIAPHPDSSKHISMTPRISFTHSSPPELSKTTNVLKGNTTETPINHGTVNQLGPKKHKQLVIKLKTNYSETMKKNEDSNFSETTFGINENDTNEMNDNNEYNDYEDEDFALSPAVGISKPKAKRKYTKRVNSPSTIVPLKRRYRKSRYEYLTFNPFFNFCKSAMMFFQY